MARKICFLRLNVKGWSFFKDIDKEVYKDLADVEVNPNTCFFFVFFVFFLISGTAFASYFFIAILISFFRLFRSRLAS